MSKNQKTTIKLEPGKSWNDSLENNVSTMGRYSQNQTFPNKFFPHIVKGSRHGEAILETLIHDEAVKLGIMDKLSDSDIQFRTDDFYHKLFTDQIAIGDVIGIPSPLHSKYLEQRVLQEMKIFDNIFKKGETFEISPSNSNFERRGETTAITKSINYKGVRFDVYAVLNNCGYLAEYKCVKDTPYTFVITGINREKAPSLKVYAELADANERKEIRQKSIETKPISKNSGWLNTVLGNAKSPVNALSDDRLLRQYSSHEHYLEIKKKEHLTMRLYNFKIKDGIVFETDGTTLAFENAAKFYGLRPTNILFLDIDHTPELHLAQGVRMTYKGSILPFNVERLDNVLINLITHHPITNILLLANSNASSFAKYHIEEMGFKVK